MAKIIIPEKGFWRVYRNTFEIDPEWRSKHQKNPIMEMFNNEKNHYILNIPKKINSISSKESDFFRVLNVHGTLEINSPCDFNLYCYEHLESDFSRPNWDRTDCFCCKNLIINTPKIDKNNKSTFVRLEIQSDGIPINKQTIETINVSADTVSINLHKMLKLKELTINAHYLDVFNEFYCPNLKKINLLNLKEFNLGETFVKIGFNLFNMASHYENNNLIKTQMFPDDCIFTLPLDCKLTTVQKIDSKNPKICKKLFLPNIKFSDFISEETSNSFKDNKDGTFSINYAELKNLVEDQLIQSLENHVTEVRKIWKTQKEILNSMYKKNIKNNFKKI